MIEAPVSPEIRGYEFVRTINRHNPEELAALIAPGHRFVDSLGNVTEGREAAQKAWAAYFRMVPDYLLAIDETYTSGPVAVMLGIAEGTYTPDGQLRAENRWQTTIAIRAFIEDGLVVEWRVYADNEPIRQLLHSSAAETTKPFWPGSLLLH